MSIVLAGDRETPRKWRLQQMQNTRFSTRFQVRRFFCADGVVWAIADRLNPYRFSRPFSDKATAESEMVARRAARAKLLRLRRIPKPS
jgi:hypothetical protein